MAIYYADEELFLEDLGGEVKQWLDRYLALEEASLFGAEPTWYYDGRDGSRSGCLEAVGLPTPNYPEPPPLKINTLYWPTGAVRWSRGVFLADDDTKDKIIEACFVRGTVIPKNLIFSTEAADNSLADTFQDGTISTKMYLLPPRPVSEVDVLNPKTKQLWLMPLVDVRYHWQNRHVGADFEPETWSSAFTTIANSLNVDISVSTVPSAYDIPSPAEHHRDYANSAYMLDAVAWSVGRRVVRWINEEVKVQSPEDAEDTLTDNLESDEWKQTAGGEITQFLPGLVPEKVAVTFRNSDGEFVTKIEEESVNHGHTGYVPDTVKVIHTNYPYDAAYSVNAEALAEQIASDYYAWLKKRYDRCFVGVKKWDPCGFDDYVEWSMRRRADGTYEAQTRVQTYPYNFGVDEMPQTGELCTSSSGDRVITYEICEACCEECWADVSIISKSFTGAVPGAGATERECGDGYTSGVEKQLASYEVRIYDIEGCFLNEQNANLVGRKGKAIYMTKDGLDCDGAVRPPKSCGGFEIPSPRWEIMTLCCDEDLC